MQPKDRRVYDAPYRILFTAGNGREKRSQDRAGTTAAGDGEEFQAVLVYHKQREKDYSPGRISYEREA